MLFCFLQVLSSITFDSLESSVKADIITTALR